MLVLFLLLWKVSAVEEEEQEGEQRQAQVSDLSFRQLEEFTLLGKFQLGQLRCS